MALAISVLAGIGSVVGMDPVITVGSILVALVKVAHAANVGRRYAVPGTKIHLYPHRLQIMR
jgi:hypothetical protein